MGTLEQGMRQLQQQLQLLQQLLQKSRQEAKKEVDSAKQKHAVASAQQAAAEQALQRMQASHAAELDAEKKQIQATTEKKNKPKRERERWLETDTWRGECAERNTCF